MIYLYRAQQAAGFELHVVPAEDDLTVRTERMLDAIDETTAVVAFSHVLFRTSYIMDAARDRRGARARSARRSSSTPISRPASFRSTSTALGVDFAVGGCLKWLCGGPGNAFLYTRPDLLTAREPSFTGWLSRAAPFAFDIDDDADLRDDAMHMMNGTPSIPAYYAALAGLDIINEVGVDRIREASRAMTARLLALVDEYGFTSAASRDPDRLAGTVAVERARRAAASRARSRRATSSSTTGRRSASASRRTSTTRWTRSIGSWRRSRRSWRRRTTPAASSPAW